MDTVDSADFLYIKQLIKKSQNVLFILASKLFLALLRIKHSYSQWKFAVWYRELKSLMLCDNLDRGRWGGVVGSFQHRGGIYLPMADSC